MKLAVKNDEYKRQLHTMKHSYEVQKATAADKQDERVEKLNEEFGALKLKLS